MSMLNNSWADGGYENRGPGPSRGVRVAITAVTVLTSVVGVAWFAKVGVDQSKAECYANAPAGASVDDVTTTFRWLPPGYDCSYAVP